MSRIKPEISTKKLSWETNNRVQYCDFKNCKLEGKYKAPKSVINLRDYYFFCLKHVINYNKSWDYYRGLSVDQIELSLRQDVIWDRPSWPTKGSSKKILYTIDKIINNNFNFLAGNSHYNSFNNSEFKGNLTLDEIKSAKKLKINPPFSLEKIKSSYKKLVKKYHPDINKEDKNAEKYFKEINTSYKILLKRILGKNK